MMARLTEEMLLDAKQKAEARIEEILGRCRSKVTGDYEDCTCPSMMPTENELIVEYLNLALETLESQ